MIDREDLAELIAERREETRPRCGSCLKPRLGRGACTCAKYCGICEGSSNHTTQEHAEAEAEQGEDPDA